MFKIWFIVTCMIHVTCLPYSFAYQHASFHDVRKSFIRIWPLTEIFKKFQRPDALLRDAEMRHGWQTSVWLSLSRIGFSKKTKEHGQYLNFWLFLAVCRRHSFCSRLLIKVKMDGWSWDIPFHQGMGPLAAKCREKWLRKKITKRFGFESNPWRFLVYCRRICFEF